MQARSNSILDSHMAPAWQDVPLRLDRANDLDRGIAPERVGREQRREPVNMRKVTPIFLPFKLLTSAISGLETNPRPFSLVDATITTSLPRARSNTEAVRPA